MTDTVTVETKRWWESKIIWTQLIGVVLEITSLTELVPLLPKEALPYLLLAHAVLTVVLRTISIQPIGAGAEQAKKGSS